MEKAKPFFSHGLAEVAAVIRALYLNSPVASAALGTDQAAQGGAVSPAFSLVADYTFHDGRV